MNFLGKPASLFQPQPQPRRGIFGGRARGVFRREDGDPGTLFNYFLYGREGVEDMREAPLRRGLLGQQIRQIKIQESEAERARMERDAALGALPENLRPFGAAALEPYVSSQMPMSAEDRAAMDFRERQFQEDQRQFNAQLGLSRRGGSQSGPTGTEREFGAMERIYDTDETMGILDRLGSYGGGEFGPIGALSGNIASTRAGALRRDVQELNSRLSLDQLQALRAQGITVGQVTEAEWRQLANDVALLDPDEDERVFESRVARIAQRYDRLQQHLRDEYRRTYERDPPPAPTRDGDISDDDLEQRLRELDQALDQALGGSEGGNQQIRPRTNLPRGPGSLSSIPVRPGGF